MKHIKVLFFDVDNTLYMHCIHDFPATTRQTLSRLRENGCRIGIATDRCHYEVRNFPAFFRDFAFDAATFDGGALITGEEEVVTSLPLLQEQVERLIRYYERRHIPIRHFIFDNDCLTTPYPHNIRDEFFKLYLNMPVVRPYEQEIVSSILAYPQNGEQREEVIALMRNAFIVTHSSSTLKITAEDVDKNKGVKAMAAHQDIPVEQITCFGDGTNDMEMLQAAGIGVVMGNASPKTKTATDHVCGSIDEDGLYHFRREMEQIQEKSCSFWRICFLLYYNRHEQLGEERQCEVDE